MLTYRFPYKAGNIALWCQMRGIDPVWLLVVSLNNLHPHIAFKGSTVILIQYDSGHPPAWFLSRFIISTPHSLVPLLVSS